MSLSLKRHLNHKLASGHLKKYIYSCNYNVFHVKYIPNCQQKTKLTKI